MEKNNLVWASLSKIDHIENVDLKEYNSFKTGGRGQIIFFPVNFLEVKTLLEKFKKERTAYFILGGGSNLLISDKGFSIPIISLKKIDRVVIEDNCITAQSGCTIETLCKKALKYKLSGLENFYGLPGSVGGATRMNARCYEKQISDVATKISYITSNGELKEYVINQNDFGYKKTPFMGSDNIILSTTFNLQKGDKDSIEKIMLDCLNDRKAKGHFNFPSAGSTFKNNRAFGKPSGAIIEECGLKSLRYNGAQVAPFHGNFIINENNATSADILTLINMVKKSVKEKTSFELETEVEVVGD